MGKMKKPQIKKVAEMKKDKRWHIKEIPRIKHSIMNVEDNIRNILQELEKA